MKNFSKKVREFDCCALQTIFESAIDAEYMDCQLYGIIDGLELAFPGGCGNVDACQVKLISTLQYIWIP